MNTYVNEETVNDTAKLAMHRIAARAVARDPSLVDDARRALDRLAERFPDRTFVGEWRDILAKDTDEIRLLLTRRDENMQRLRLSSPFMMVPRIDLREPATRLRIWRLARRLAIRSSERGERRETRPGTAA